MLHWNPRHDVMIAIYIALLLTSDCCHGVMAMIYVVHVWICNNESILFACVLCLSWLALRSIGIAVRLTVVFDGG